MVVEEVVINASDVVGGLVDGVVPVLLDKAGPLITIFKAVGVVLVVYVIYLIYSGIIKMRDRRRLKRIDKKVAEIDRKLDKLLNKGDGYKRKKK